jgi:hypothetical protein
MTFRLSIEIGVTDREHEFDTLIAFYPGEDHWIPPLGFHL